MNYLLKLMSIAISLFFIELNAQTKTFYIVNGETKIPIQNASVQTSKENTHLLSDENGLVTLPYSSNKETITISAIGYATETINLAEIKENIYLYPKTTRLSEVVIQGKYNNIFKPISDFDIHLRPMNNSQEVLRMIPGIFIGQHAGGGKAEQIFLRGFDLDHGTDINISVDGMPVNMVSHAHGQGYSDLHFVIPELIDKINFNKGPYFANKGNFTTAGFVEFNTYDFLEKNFVKVEAGQFDTYRAVAGIDLLNFNKKERNRKDQALYLAGESSFTQGYFDDNQDFKRYNGILKYHGKLNDKNTLTASISGFYSKWNASGQIPDRAVENGMIGWYGAIDNTEGGETSRYNFNSILKTKLNNGFMKNQIFYSNYNFELFSNFTFFKEDPINGDQIKQKENRNIIGFNNYFENNFNLGKLKTVANYGIQVRYDNVNNLELSRTKDRKQITQRIMLGDVNEINGAAFYNQKFIVNQKFNITAGLRYDYFNNQYEDKLLNKNLSANSSILSPKLNFNYQLNNNIQLYWFNGKGFHSNDTRVAVAEKGKKVLPPAWGSDLGGIFKIGKKLILQSAFWYLWLDQEFVYVGDEGVVEAGGKTQRLGLDLSLRYEIIDNLFFDTDLSWANPKALNVPKKEHYLALAPRFTSAGGITYRKLEGFNGSLRYRYMANRPANKDNSTIAKGYFIFDAALNYTQKKWEIGLAIQNLFDKKWKETQFDTESQLQGETSPVSEIHFTPGTPFFAKLSFVYYF